MAPRHPVEIALRPLEVEISPQADLDVCVFCTLCARKCPAEAITVDRAEKKWGARPGRVSVLRSLRPELPEEMHIHGGLMGIYDVMPSRGRRGGLERQGKEDA